ncbi:hypothetical protein Prum_030320 [Phytohabitans rumicis]|uniref:Uncharacterized protein n=1 Tax=Phytohabitans rumicis TaxID=1076125 RepID=A0A6V8L1C3_9ACTN|nr:hypothetical protein Prum_030320 [Phytohabitans rumicis]
MPPDEAPAFFGPVPDGFFAGDEVAFFAAGAAFLPVLTTDGRRWSPAGVLTLMAVLASLRAAMRLQVRCA